MSASVNDKAFEKKNFIQGNVQWKRISHISDVNNITADYLIICANDFFPLDMPHPEVLRLAQHRSYYNGFDIMILNVEDILSNSVGFYYEGNPNDPNPINWDKYKKEQRMRTCIRTIYENGHAHHTGDGKLGYVLLIGDNYKDNTGMPNTGMPVSYNHNVIAHNSTPYINEPYPSTYYFSCITKYSNGSYDEVGDLFIGRLSVEHDRHLFNMVQKIIHFEAEFVPQVWRKSAGFSHGKLVTDFSSFYLEQLQYFTSSSGWNYTLANHNELSNSDYKTATLNYFNSGVTFAQYFGLGSIDSWGIRPNLKDTITQSDFLNGLNNCYKAPFVNAVSNWTGNFDNMECLGEFLTRYDSCKGAVGYIGASRSLMLYCMKDPSNTNPQQMTPQARYLFYLFKEQLSISGELLLTTLSVNVPDDPNYNSMILRTYKHAFTLFGDPALNIFAEGYEITHDVTAEICPVEIPYPVKVHNGAKFTIPDGCHLYFLTDGSLTVESDSKLHIGNQVQIYSNILSLIKPTIHIKGDMITGTSVTFQNVNVLLGNSLNLSTPWLYSDNKQFVLNNLTFNNAPVTHYSSRLNISNCTFNAGSNLYTAVSKSTIDNCTFNATKLKSDHAMLQINPNPMVPATVVTNCHFSGYNSSGMAMQLQNSTSYKIANNTISGYATGISLDKSGTTQSIDGRIPAVITNNNVSNSNTGIELFNSVAQFSSNHIHNNNHGVRLHNNSYTTFGNSSVPPVVHQIIEDCSSIELYASANSFPTLFRYNQVIDEDNLGNRFNDPLLFWDITSPSLVVHNIKINYWGNNFFSFDDLYPPDSFICDPLWDPSKSASPSPGVDETLYQTALTYFAEEDYPNAELTFKELIETYPNSQFAIAALHELFAIQQLTNHDYYTLHDYYTTITSSDSNLFEVADFLATRCYVKEKFWQPAVDWYEYRIENPPTYQDSVFAVIDLGDIHLMMEADTVSGTKSGGSCHYRFPFIKPKSKQAYEENKTTLLATLPQIKKTQTEKPLIPQSGKRGSLGQNIPNPATGTTSIGYEIYTAGAVEINLYNAFGQLVKNLPIGMVQAGSHKTTVSLTDLAPGIYHYTLSVNGERTDAKKMVVK